MATKSTTTSDSALTPITVEMFSEKLAKHRISLPLLRQVIVAYQANLRHSNADTKRRGEVNGGGRKPWRQKGTGRARVGSSRTPLWRGGGIVFGPTPAKNYTQSITKTAKLQSLATALKLKVRAGLAHSVSMNDLPAKTKQAQLAIAPALTGGMVLIVVSDTSKAKAFANIAGAKLMTPTQLTATWVSAARSVVFVGETWEATKAKFE